MILTCPECATSYFVDDARIPPKGRTVRCSSCGVKWRAEPEGIPEGPAERDDSDLFFEEASPAETEAVAVPEPEPEPETFIPPIAPPRRREPRAPKPRKPSRQAGKGPTVIAWVSVAAVVVMVAAVLLGRGVIVSVFPPSNKLFAAIGLPVDRLGLVIDQVKFQPTFLAGRPVLSVTGAIRNTRKQTVSTPALRVSLLDKEGKPLTAKLARPLNPKIPGGATRYFAIAIADPPAGSQKLQVAFEEEDPATQPVAPPEGTSTTLGPEPMEAKPLPPGAPEALEKHG
jgi:predicted Zn finger-like uncharacterized protein